MALLPPEYDFAALFGSDQFKDFGESSDGFRIVYPLATQKFPIGHIADKNTPADLGRAVVERALGANYGTILHLSLAHDEHNIVEVLDKGCGQFLGKHRTFVADGLIVRRCGDHPFVIETFLGDCACVAVWSKDHVGYMHIGRPEIMAEPNVIENFFKVWPSNPEESRIWVGPCIGGSHYELPDIPNKFRRYAVETIWETQGFSLVPAIIDQIGEFGMIDGWQMDVVDYDPYRVNEYGDHSWAASDQWYRRLGRQLGFPLFSPRNSAMLFVER